MGKRVSNASHNSQITNVLENNKSFVQGVHKFNNFKKNIWKTIEEDLLNKNQRSDKNLRLKGKKSQSFWDRKFK